ncbi:MAG TPA: hypothetical protein ENG87_01175 [Candidatus Pacearchaeota archaeon]|nr:hypothetical protein [Candidatus Pacearchaeota archaeon]
MKQEFHNKYDINKKQKTIPKEFFMGAGPFQRPEYCCTCGERMQQGHKKYYCPKRSIERKK